MPQQINLMHAGLVRKRQAWTSQHALLCIAAALLLSGAATLACAHLGAQAQLQAAQLEQQGAALQARSAALEAPAAPLPAALELQRLRSLEAGQRQVRSAIDSGGAGQTQGYAAYFMALSRQAHPALWITGFSVAADGAALELTGRMAEPTLLPDYLRRLNGEALFKGRDFAQLSLKAVDAEGEGGTSRVTEFTLRSKPTGVDGK